MPKVTIKKEFPTNIFELENNTKVNKLEEKFKEIIYENREAMKKTEKCKQMLEICNHSSGSLINLINDLLDLAKQEN